jgi:hypothetical protein
MPITYTNRKKVTYTLFRTQSASGSMHYSFALKSRGEPVEELPPGFRISESPNGVVTLVKERPELILPEEVAAVEDEVARHPRADRYRVVVKPDRIEVHAAEGPDTVYGIRDLEAAGLIKVERIPKRILEMEERLTRYVPVLRFALHDRVERSFRADGRHERRYTVAWRKLGPARDVGDLARALVPNIGAETPFGFKASEIVMPWADWLARQAARLAHRGPVTSVHRLKVTLRQIRPPIWRRIEVPSNVTLAYMHIILQDTMGWSDDHLHDFQVGDVHYGDPRQLEDIIDYDERKVRLAGVAPNPKDRLRYRYDFGDGWEHDILVEAIGPPQPDVRYPRCLAGKRACPPEDCGGPWGYANMLQAMADPSHPMHRDVSEWLGGPIDPEAFDPEEVNRRLA